MKPARPAWPLALVYLAALAFPGTDLLSQATQSAREELEDRLLEGELLEVSSGDLDKAMTVYRALIVLPDTPESVRARALLYLARCHRKLGQVDRAKELLDRLVEKHAEERDVLRQARAFLRELRGEKINPEFDWLGELGKSPEIQARVFDLAMDMVDLDGETGQTARRQLLALGSVGIPVLEKMVTTSRDARHRHHLALLLVKMGKLEYWKVLLDPKSPLSTGLSSHTTDNRQTSSSILIDGLSVFFRSIPGLSAGERAHLLEVIAAIPKDTATEPYRQFILLRAGAVEEFAPAIPALEELLHHRSPRLGVELRFFERLESDPAAPKALATRMLHPECRTPDDYYRLLLERAPGTLEASHHALMLERLLDRRIDRNRSRIDRNRSPGTLQRENESHPLIARLEKSGAFEVLERFTAGLLAPNLVDYFWKTHVEAGRPSEAPAGWARVLRRARPVELKYTVVAARNDHRFNYPLRFNAGPQVLHLMAETNDGFVAELQGFLRELEEEDPDYRGYGERFVWPWLKSSWKPSEHYVETIQNLLEGAPPFATIVALEALSLAAPLADTTLRRVEALASGSDDDLVREYALYTLVRHFTARPEYGPRVVRALMAEALRRLDGKETIGTDPLPFGSVLARPKVTSRPPVSSRSSSTRRPSRVPQSRPRRAHYGEQPAWAVTQAREPGHDVSIELYPLVVDLTIDEEGRRFHTWYFEMCIEDREQTGALLLAKAVEFEDPERKAYAMPYLGSLGEEHHDQLASFLKLIATDREIEIAKRKEAIHQAGKKSVEWFDWPEFLRSDDPFVPVLMHVNTTPTVASGRRQVQLTSILQDFVKEQDAAWQDAFWAAALESPHRHVRSHAYYRYPLTRPDAVDVLRGGLKDPDERLHYGVKDRITSARSNNTVPLLLVLLEDPDRQWRRNAIRALKNLALQESVEPLVKALDDPDYEVRSEALEALKAIRATLEEKREWQELLEQIKK